MIAADDDSNQECQEAELSEALAILSDEERFAALWEQCVKELETKND